MKSIGNHRLQMGLADCAVQMITAIDSHDRKGSMYHAHPDGGYGKVQMPKICKGEDGCGAEVTPAEIAKGYEHDGENVIMTTADLDTVQRNSGADIEVLRLVLAKEVNPLKFSGEKCYWLLPDQDKKRSGKLTNPVYLAFMQTLIEAEKVAVVQYTKWNKTRVGLVRVEPSEKYGNVLVLQNMIWPDELRVPDFPVLDKLKDEAVTAVAAKLLPQMRAVGESLTEPWNDDDYHDVYEEQLGAAIQAKADGKAITELASEDAAPPPDDVADLLAKLEASVKKPAKAPARKAPATAPARKRGAA